MVNKLSRETINVTLNSSGTGSGYSNVIRGAIKAVEIEYGGGSDMTFDLLQLNPANSGTGYAIQHILGPISGKGADPKSDNAVYYPRAYAQDKDGTDLTFDGTHKIATEFIVHGRLFLDARSGTGSDTIAAHIYYEEY